jgi:putative transcriptional regulator
MKLSRNELRSLREKEKLSQEKLAEELGVTRQTVLSIEKGKYVPSLPLALKIAKRFDCPVEEIFGMEEDENG